MEVIRESGFKVEFQSQFAGKNQSAFGPTKLHTATTLQVSDNNFVADVLLYSDDFLSLGVLRA